MIGLGRQGFKSKYVGRSTNRMILYEVFLMMLNYIQQIDIKG